MDEQTIRNFLVSYGDKVRRARIKLELTQLKLARLIGCSQAIISHIECGYMLPPPHIKKAISEILKV